MTPPPDTTLIETFSLGPFATNCSIVHTPGRPECWIVDASFGPAPLIQRVRDLGLTPQKILLTHAHIDHIAGLPDLRAAFPGVPVCLHREEWAWLEDAHLNLSGAMGEPFTAAPPDEELTDGQTLTLGDLEAEVRHTPGHSPGSVSLVMPAIHAAIVGDTLFNGSIGRTDFPTSDHEALVSAIRTRLYTLPDETTAHPGHGPSTTIGAEKRTNPFVRGEVATGGSGSDG